MDLREETSCLSAAVVMQIKLHMMMQNSFLFVQKILFYRLSKRGGVF